MARCVRRNLIQAGAAAAIFAAGVLSGTMLQRPVEAQIGDVMKKAAGAAGEQGGALGAAAKLATSITDLQQHVGACKRTSTG
jgi:hypothetical protein